MTTRIITVTPARLGETVFITPTLRMLKMIEPESEIDVIAISPLAYHLLEGNPYIHRLMLLPKDDEVIDQYDVKINIHDSKTARAYLDKINAQDVMYQSVKKRANLPRAHQLLIWFAQLLNFDLSQYEMHYDVIDNAEHHASVQQILLSEQPNFDQKRLIGLHVGCHGLTKKRSRLWGKFSHKKAWPLKNFIKLAQKLNNEHNDLMFVLTGSKEEAPLAREFANRIPNTINLVDRLSVLELKALMHYLVAFITNDTGALHVASASDVNLIALFGDTNAAVHGPFPRKKNQIVLEKNPIKRIKIKEVMKAVQEFLK